MKIAIEAQRIFRKNKHGMDFVALESIKELQKIDKKNQYYILVAPGEDKCLKETGNFKIIEFGSTFYPCWEQFNLPRELKKIKPDILHCTSNTAPFFCSVPLILTLHDIIFLEPRGSKNKSLYQNLGWYYRKLIVPKILPKCNKIITVSSFECKRIKESLKLSDDMIMYIYNGFNNHFTMMEDVDYSVTKKYIDSEKYLFFLGNTDPKKNLERTIDAYNIYNSRSTKKLPLLIADLDNKILDSLLKDKDLEYLKSQITCVKYIDNKDLTYIYNKASIFLYPSLRESFGIPILESMACGTPVIAGNTSSMPEVIGDNGILADPFNSEDIASKILLLENNNDLYDKIRSYGLERVKSFSWKNTAENLIKVYTSIYDLNKK